MKQTINHETLGEIVYEEGFWLGRKMLYINGAELEKLSKNVFRTESGEQVTLKGNFATGVSMQIGAETIQLTPKIKWYEITLSVLPLILVLVWGNSATLCKIVPIVGGAIGGLIGGVFCALNMVLVKKVRPVWLKILISVGMLGATFAVCYGIACAILAAV